MLVLWLCYYYDGHLDIHRSCNDTNNNGEYNYNSDSERDASSLVSPMDLPSLTKENNKQLEYKTFF